MYADVELLLTGWLRDRLATVERVVTELPANLATHLPVVQVVRVPGGGDAVVSIDQALVDVDVYAATRGEANELAEQVRDLLRFTLPGQVIDGTQVLRVDTNTAPGWVPWPDNSLRRSHASYRLYVQ